MLLDIDRLRVVYFRRTGETTTVFSIRASGQALLEEVTPTQLGELRKTVWTGPISQSDEVFEWTAEDAFLELPLESGAAESILVFTETDRYEISGDGEPPALVRVLERLRELVDRARAGKLVHHRNPLQSAVSGEIKPR